MTMFEGAAIRGGCLCGKVRYTSDAAPAMVAICNCLNCQKQSGGPYSVNVGIPKGSLRWDGVEPKTYVDQGSSGMPVRRRFCADCGSPIVSEVDAHPTLDFLKSGTLDDTSWIRPQAAGWCVTKQQWVEFPAALPQFERGRPAPPKP